MALTDAKIRGYKPRSTRYLETDGRGLSLDILPSGTMSWLYRYRLNGRYEKVVLGRYPEMTLKGATAGKEPKRPDPLDGEVPGAGSEAGAHGLSNQLNSERLRGPAAMVGTRYIGKTRKRSRLMLL